MRLVNVKVQGYRRFEQPVSIDVSGNVIALVGPNEAGKTSILSALLSLNDDSGFSASERTRPYDGDSVNRGPEVAATYIIDDDDREILADIPGVDNIQRFTMVKFGEIVGFSVDRPPERDLSRRHALASQLAAGRYSLLSALRRLRRDRGSSDEYYHARLALTSLLERALEVLMSTDPELREPDIQSVRRFAKTVLEDAELTSRLPPGFRELVERLSVYHDVDPAESQWLPRLNARRPRFLLFEPADRDLKSTYDLKEVVTNTPPALRNLARLAGLDLERLLHAAQSDPGLRVKLLEDANKKLEDVFERNWRQARVSVHLSVQGTTLEVFVKNAESGDFMWIEERSAGLRWFVALCAFLAQQDLVVPPILLVDEAETHLHYDAQADLVRLFHEQKIAAKIIYTTHSAACLPRDLGTGIRVVTPTGPERSTVRNSVWQDGQAGLTPLVYAMGATTFAFLPARYVLIGEGPTDAMVYPTLFREATGLETLSFQVVPGIAVVSPERMWELLGEGGTVAFIVDGDDDGKRYRTKLEEAGVPANHIFSLEEVYGEPLELEDLIDRTPYVQAVNRLLSAFQSGAPEFSETDIPDIGRTKALRNWCEKNGLKLLDKRKVAQELLDLKSERIRDKGEEIRLLCSQRKSGLESLYYQIDRALHGRPA